MNGYENPSEIVTKSRAYYTWFPLMKTLLLWRYMYFITEQIFVKGNEIGPQHTLSPNMSSIPISTSNLHMEYPR